jgi:hypothetical protein
MYAGVSSDFLPAKRQSSTYDRDNVAAYGSYGDTMTIPNERYINSNRKTGSIVYPNEIL